jgi:hypothetical protein
MEGPLDGGALSPTSAAVPAIRNAPDGYICSTMSDITAEIEALIRAFTYRVVGATHVQVGKRLLAVVAVALTESVPAPNPGRLADPFTIRRTILRLKESSCRYVLRNLISS